MSNRENLNKKMAEISAIDDKRTKRPKHIPSDACILGRFLSVP